MIFGLRHNFFLAYFISFAFFSCLRQSREEKISSDEMKEHIINANKIFVHDESKQIDDFIFGHGWKMQTTGFGLRIQMTEEGKGRQPNLNDTVTIACKVFLLDGALCYSFDKKKPMLIVLGKGMQTNGLEEGLQLIKEGGSARMVVPAHLAFGFVGDENKIPPNASLYYEVSLLNISPKK